MIKKIRDSKLQNDDSIIWVLWASGILMIAFIPDVVFYISKLLGFLAPINLIFLILIYFSYILLFNLFLKVSVIRANQKDLIHELAFLKEELDKND
jgi:hypothetical protein